MDLITACLNGNILAVQQLLAQKDTDVNAGNQYGATALMYAAGKGHTEIVGALVEKGADVNVKTTDGYTALICAAKHGNVEIVSALVEKGADVNVKTTDGQTALMLAARGGHTDIVKLLLIKGANVNAKTTDGNTALMFAARNNHTEIAQLLKAYGTGRSWMLRGGLILLGAGLVGVGLIFGLGYVLPALSFGMKLTVSIASACTVLLLGYGIDHSVQGAHQVRTSITPSDAAAFSSVNGRFLDMRKVQQPQGTDNNARIGA